MAITELSKKWDVDFMLCGCLGAMLAFLRLYVSGKGIDWHAVLLIAATTVGKGVVLCVQFRHGLGNFLRTANNSQPVCMARTSSQSWKTKS